MKKNQITAVFFILVFLFSINTKQVYAKWDSKKDQLPGYNESSNTGLIIAASAGVGVLVYFLIKKNKQKSVAVNMVKYRESKQILLWENNLNTKDTNITNASQAKSCKEKKRNNALVIDTQGNLLQQVENASKTMPVNLLVAPLNTNDKFAMKNINGIQVGLRFKF